MQLMRDLQDSMEREADIREQLKFAEEEVRDDGSKLSRTISYLFLFLHQAGNLRKKATRVEDENESLMMQLKKMATKNKSEFNILYEIIIICVSVSFINTHTARRLSPTPPKRNSLNVPDDKHDGASDEEDPAELRVLLELNEQESTQLRRKMAELERNNEASRKQITELQEKLKNASSSASSGSNGKLPTFMSKTMANEKESDRRLKAAEVELVELRKNVQEKEKAIEQLQKSAAKTIGYV